MNQKVDLEGYELVDERRNDRCTIRCWRPKNLTEEARMKALREFKKVAIEMATELHIESQKNNGIANI